MRGLIVLIILFVIIVGGAIFLSRGVAEQPTHMIEIPVTPQTAPAK